MTPTLLLWIALTSAASEPPWQDLVFTITPEPGVSADTVTLCRVRVTNNGSRTWAGRGIRFEAQALAGSAIVERAQGRFGLTLAPRETLETLIGFSGHYERFAVRPLPKASERLKEPRHGRRSRGGGRRPRAH